MKKFVQLLVHSVLVFGLVSRGAGMSPDPTPAGRPNFLLILSDDQSWEHTSFAGYPLVETPNFDRIAREGVYFANSYASAPTCTASRSSILAGQPIWRLGAAANLQGVYSPPMISFQQILAEAGYEAGSTGKGWGPGYIPPEQLKPMPPTGRWYNEMRRPADRAHGPIDYAANFAGFLDEREPGSPFSFWVGSVEPHRPYNPPAANRFKGRDEAGFIPGTLPPTRQVKAQLSAYLEEIEFFDRDVGRLLDVLETRRLLDKTVVIVTSDNGMPFSRAKQTNYQYGVRVPLAVRWGGISHPGRVVKDFVSLADIAPTVLDLAGIPAPAQMTGRSLRYALLSGQSGIIDPARDVSFTAFERHMGFVRGGAANLTYPRRAIHSEQYIYIRNYFPDRWPAGDPPQFSEAYVYLLVDSHSNETFEPYFTLSTEKRPAEELYDIRLDPYQLNNLAQVAGYEAIRNQLSSRLHRELVDTGDPLEITGRDVFQDFPYCESEPAGSGSMPAPRCKHAGKVRSGSVQH